MHRLMMTLALMLAPMLSYAQPACWPAPHGDGVGKTQGMTDDGEWHAWHCPGTYDWSTVLLVKRTGYVLRLPEAWDKPFRELLDDVWMLNAQHSCASPPAELTALCEAARAGARRTLPLPPLYQVAPNPRAVDDPPTRPMYRRISEAEVSSSPVSGQRAPVGEECACYHSRAVVGNTTYCMIPREPVQVDLLAVCTRAE